MNSKNSKKFVSRYFDKDLDKAAEEMATDEMVSLLRELEGTRYWVAITKYVQDRLILAQSTLCAIDPIKAPTDIARAQGILSGLLDLQDMIRKSNEAVKEAEKKANNKDGGSSASDDAPGYMS